MEKEIETILDSFLYDFDRRKLELLDKMLFSLLLKKEIFLLTRQENKEIKKIKRILARYGNYQDFIFKRLQGNKNIDRSFLVKNIYPPPARLILLLTHNCQLRCKYCRVRKFPATMDESVLFKGINLLFSSQREDLQLQFFGGEPLLKFDLIKKAIKYAQSINKTLKRNLTYILTTNGIALTRDKVDFLKEYNFIVECSIDGEVENQLKARKARNAENYYSQVIDNFSYLFRSKIPHYSISVVMPNNVLSMSRNFGHLVSLGFKKLQMNYSLGIFWPATAIKRLFLETEKISAKYLKTRKDIEFINLTSMRKEPVVLNAELTIDCDGDIYSEYGICLEEDFLVMKRKFFITNVNKAEDINFYSSTHFQNFYRLSNIYSSGNPKFRKIILNNIFLGRRYDGLLKSLFPTNIKMGYK